jgi:cytoskeletal protein RodZ
MGDFSDKLRRAREDKGVSLRDIAAATKISVGALEALERGAFARLPGGIFSRAFVRAYALEVGLDPELTVQEFLVEMGKNEHDSAEAAPRPEVTADDREFLERQRSAGRWLRVVVIGIVVIVIAVVAWELRARLRP